MTGDQLSYLILWDRTSGCARVEMAEEGNIDAAVSTYIDSGKTRDTLLHLTTTGGAAYCVLASEITSWSACTPESREREAAVEHAVKEEEKARGWTEDE